MVCDKLGSYEVQRELVIVLKLNLIFIKFFEKQGTLEQGVALKRWTAKALHNAQAPQALKTPKWA